MTNIHLTLACSEYDRTKPLALGDVQPEGIDLTYLMLADGTIDALLTARTPSSFSGPASTVRRLFLDYRAVEREYFSKTRIFPIMHVVAVRKEVLERHPWAARSLYKAFCQAKDRLFQQMMDAAAFEEAIRWESPVQTFFRTTMREVDIAGQHIPAGEKMLLFLGAANRDSVVLPLK